MGRGIQFAASDRVGTAASTVMFGDAGTIIMAVLIMVSTFGCNNGLILAGARVYYTMAKDGLFFARAGVLNGRSVPGVALWFQAVWASLLCLSGTYGDLAGLRDLCGSCLLYPDRGGDLHASSHTTRYGAAVPCASGIPCSRRCTSLRLRGSASRFSILKPVYTWPGVGIVLAGIPVYFVWRRVRCTPCLSLLQ